ncbi:uncharacterized protein LOC130408891 [Triplophysa dalaica]|uniref:uncharacterized protein LOC130408891 n=1 Tax=Triplophysa dalaica TaxID=1582913 RepID=UPI0024DFC88B|nr:uncharacterized protein LOC130408891 [Triplophysa dalaica]
MKSLSFSTWNIQGLNSSVFGLKSRNSDFMKDLEDIDVIILQETWCRGDVFTGCPSGYREIILPSVKLTSVTQGRDSGGMILWIKSKLAIELVKKDQYHLWLKVQKGIISASQPVFLCAIYIPPLESPYFQEETFQNIEQEISHFQAQGNVLLMGDLNARTGKELDFLESQGTRFLTGNNNLYPSYPARENCDQTVNAHGRQLLKLCRGLALYIVNGRLRGDSLGRYTYSSALDDLVLLSPTEEGLQDSLNLLEDYCQTWALTLNLQKTRVMMFQKRSRSQGPSHTFTLSHRTIETTKTYTYLGLKITTTGNFTLAVNELKEKAQRAFYAIKRSIKIDITIQIWLKLFKAVIEPIVLYGSEVWGPSIKFDFLNWEKHPIEILHLDFCKRILKVQRKTPNNGCRAELGQYPLLLNIQKRAVIFWKHLKTSDPNTYHYKALKHQELSVGKSPLLQLVLRLTVITHTEISQLQDTHTLTHIINTEKEKYTTYWTNTTKNQHKLECYSALNREYTIASYLNTVSDVRLRKTLTRYRLSEHSLAIETGRRRQTWISREDRLCSHCMMRVMETELHFLTECPKYKDIREHYYPKINHIFPQFNSLNQTQKLRFILGEEAKCCHVAARYVSSCDLLRDSQRDTNNQ